MSVDKVILLKKIQVLLNRCRFMFEDPSSKLAIAQIEKQISVLLIEAQK